MTVAMLTELGTKNLVVMLTYLEQLEAQCAEADLDLAEVCRAEGVAATTLARWRKGESHCREATAKTLFRRIEDGGEALIRQRERRQKKAPTKRRRSPANLVAPMPPLGPREPSVQQKFPDVVKQRKCLGCGRIFKSSGIGNRLCAECR